MAARTNVPLSADELAIILDVLTEEMDEPSTCIDGAHELYARLHRIRDLNFPRRR